MIPQVVFRVVTWIITVIIGAVRALCPRRAKTPPKTRFVSCCPGPQVTPRSVSCVRVEHLVLASFGEWGSWASRTWKCGAAGGGRPQSGGAWAAETVKRPPQQTAEPPLRQLLGTASAQTAHLATSSTALAHRPLGSATAETTPAGAPAAAANRTQRPDATCEGKNG